MFRVHTIQGETRSSNKIVNNEIKFEGNRKQRNGRNNRKRVQNVAESNKLLYYGCPSFRLSAINIHTAGLDIEIPQ